MRTAICFSGQPRSFDKTYESIFENLIKPNSQYGDQVDIFIHTWVNIENYDKDLYNQKNIKLSCKLTKNTVGDYYNLYKPKKFLVENQIDFAKLIPLYDLGDYWGTLISWYSYLYSLYTSNNLKKQYEQENNFKYDWVIRCRTDQYYNAHLILNDYENEYLNMSYEAWGQEGDKYIPVVNDRFCFASSQIMDKYCNLYMDIIEKKCYRLLTLSKDVNGHFRYLENIHYMHIFTQNIFIATNNFFDENIR